MLRRTFLLSSAAAMGAISTAAVAPLTRGPKHHFFGYYGICPWNRSARKLVCLEVGFQDRMPRPDEPASVMLIDAESGDAVKVAETFAWNFQQGAMLHWNPVNPEEEILFNQRDGDAIVSVSLNTRTGKQRKYPRQIDGVSHSGKWALSLTSGRLQRLRPVVGYTGAVDPNPSDKHPDKDGAFLIDLETGETKLVASIGETYRRLVGKNPELKDRDMFFNHTVFNKSNSRFFFLSRCFTPEGRLESAMFTCNRDGSDMREAVPFGKGVSHFEWRNDREIMATFRLLPGVRDVQHVLFTDGKADYKQIGAGYLTSDGHCSFGPDSEWFVTDKNIESTLSKRLIVYNVRTDERAVLGEFPMGSREFLSGDRRCDLHPRWSRDGKAICFDAIDAKTGLRQVWVARLRPS